MCTENREALLEAKQKEAVRGAEAARAAEDGRRGRRERGRRERERLVKSGHAQIDRKFDYIGHKLTPLEVAEKNNHAAVVAYMTVEVRWHRRRSYAKMLNSLKGADTTSTIMRVFQCYDLARLIGSYL